MANWRQSIYYYFTSGDPALWTMPAGGSRCEARDAPFEGDRHWGATTQQRLSVGDVADQAFDTRDSERVAMAERPEPIVGIDLGTTYSVVAALDPLRPASDDSQPSR